MLRNPCPQLAFSWSRIKGTDYYNIIIAADEGMSQLIFESNPNEEFYQYPAEAPPLNSGTKYYWNVIAKDANDSPLGDVSNTGSFSTPSGNIEIELIYEKSK